MTRINHNIASMINQKYLGRHEASGDQTLHKLSTGMRINKAEDDQPGFAASEKLRLQIRGNQQASRNAQDGSALLNIAEGAASEIGSMLQRMRELGIQASSDTLTSTDRSYLDQEFQALKSEIGRIAMATQYNGMTLLDGGAKSFGSATSMASVLHIGGNTKQVVDRVHVTIQPVTVGALGLQRISLTDHAHALGAIGTIDEAINSVNLLRSGLGAVINRIDMAMPLNQSSTTNLQAAETLIRDVDFAEESTEFAKLQILQQSSQAMLTQANSLPDRILSLFGSK